MAPHCAVGDASSSRSSTGSESIYLTPSTSTHVGTISLPEISSDHAVPGFFTEQEQQSIFDRNQPHRSTPRNLSFPRRDTSTSSVHTIIPVGTLHITIPELCDVIKAHSSLRRAEITSTEVYTEYVGSVKHRFIILELVRTGRKSIWVRLDRRTGHTIFGLLRRLGAAPAKDTAQLSPVKESLLGHARRENRQEFATVPSLGELQFFLQIISQELVRYTVWPENCYFFCSLIQEHLGADSDGAFVYGELPHPRLASKIRQKIKDRVRLLYHMPLPVSRTELLRSLAEEGLLMYANEALSHSLVLDGSQKMTADPLVYVGFKTRELLVCLESISKQLQEIARHAEALAISQQRLILLRQLREHSCIPTSELAIALCQHARILQVSKHPIDAYSTNMEAIQIIRDILAHPDQHRMCLPKILHHYSISLRQANLEEEACVASTEAVTLTRKLSDRDRERRQKHLARSLSSCSRSLRSVRRAGEACQTGAEAVALRRELYKRKPEKNRESLALCLFQYGIYLREADRADEACDAGAEATALCRDLYLRNPSQFHDKLVVSLRQWGISLTAAGRTEETLVIDAEIDSREVA